MKETPGICASRGKPSYQNRACKYHSVILNFESDDGIDLQMSWTRLRITLSLICIVQAT